MNTSPAATVSNTAKVLRNLLSIELVLVAMYHAGLDKVTDPYVRQQIAECQRSHLMRVDILREELEDLGLEHDDVTGVPPGSRGTDFDGAADPVHVMRDAEVATLKAMRDLCNRGEIDFDVRDLIEGDLLCEQERTDAITGSLAIPL